MSGRFDLHTHSTVSDGSLAPEELVALAKAKGLDGIALTDHDNVGGLGRASGTGMAIGVRVVPGIELSVDIPRGETRSAVREGQDADAAGGRVEVHLLGYFIDASDARLAARLTELRSDRATRNARIVAKLAALGIAVSVADVEREAGFHADQTKSVGRPHIAAALVRAGAASSVRDAFDRYLAAGRPAYVPKSRLDARDAIRLVRDAGGAPVLAHPFTLPAETRAETIARLASFGLVGVEVVYPRHDAALRRGLAALAVEHRLVATGGSDFHGAPKPDIELGADTVGRSVVEELAERAQR
ncbi:MAG: PHP domain-containing protein [Thermoplasmatota archaeon]